LPKQIRITTLTHNIVMARNRRKTSWQFTAPRVSEYSTKELSKQTWSDFERLFKTHPAPGAHPCWCMYSHRRGPEPKRDDGDSRVKWIERNRREKKALLEQGCSHGILVYAHGEPVGWCQFGLSEELPRIEKNPRYRKFTSEGGGSLWRITCFVVHKKYRRRGVARTALKAAVAAIRNAGGGLVEAYPIKRWGGYQEYRGTMSMFEKEGFQIVAPLGASNVLMRRAI